MFTGIIQSVGEIKEKKISGKSIRFTVKPAEKNFLKNTKTGDSIAINGACMTLEEKNASGFKFTVIAESLGKTNLGALTKGSSVNLEKAMTMNSKLDGHIVQGHIDATGKLKKITLQKDLREYFIEFNSKFSKNIINVGSITINGVSLTIADIIKETSKNVVIKVAIIPHTYNVTTFKYLKEGDSVNMEFDMIGKYVERIVKR